jgi:hypothetical protein
MMPSTELSLPGQRVYASGAVANVGSFATAYTVVSSQLGGFYTAAMALPRDFDRSRDAFVDAFIYGTAAGAIAAGVVQLELGITFIDPAGTATNLTRTILQALPANFNPAQHVTVPMLNAGAATITGGTLPDQADIGFRIARNGPAVPDNWPSTLAFLTSLRLRYNRLCRFCDSC